MQKSKGGSTTQQIEIEEEVTYNINQPLQAPEWLIEHIAPAVQPVNNSIRPITTHTIDSHGNIIVEPDNMIRTSNVLHDFAEDPTQAVSATFLLSHYLDWRDTQSFESYSQKICERDKYTKDPLEYNSNTTHSEVDIKINSEDDLSEESNEIFNNAISNETLAYDEANRLIEENRVKLNLSNQELAELKSECDKLQESNEFNKKNLAEAVEAYKKLIEAKNLEIQKLTEDIKKLQEKLEEQNIISQQPVTRFNNSSLSNMFTNIFNWLTNMGLTQKLGLAAVALTAAWIVFKFGMGLNPLNTIWNTMVDFINWMRPGSIIQHTSSGPLIETITDNTPNNVVHNVTNNIQPNLSESYQLTLSITPSNAQLIVQEPPIVAALETIANPNTTWTPEELNTLDNIWNNRENGSCGL